ncbi:hypothetical protein OPT61_g9994 [Boeremia exigua]|uniref:Uncharacterized protein n=1 Tax=Boeremia exigua TaxID=749465 RepID=A0ACC2HRQ2_9PLEO|nr:hypothetical protein OPT61_g9994 [Boeremia exigua]
MQILTVIEDNLATNMEKIERWQQRKKDRQDQEPRWTDRDKRNYFIIILRLTLSSNRKADKIKQLRDDVKTFRDSLPNQLKSIQEDLNFRGSQNINLFTYVTVVFLPLGFATGILSMSGPPEHAWLMDLIPLSLAALAITVFALLNAEGLQMFINPVVKMYQQVTLPIWTFSALLFSKICYPVLQILRIGLFPVLQIIKVGVFLVLKQSATRVWSLTDETEQVKEKPVESILVKNKILEKWQLWLDQDNHVKERMQVEPWYKPILEFQFWKAMEAEVAEQKTTPEEKQTVLRQMASELEQMIEQQGKKIFEQNKVTAEYNVKVAQQSKTAVGQENSGRECSTESSVRGVGISEQELEAMLREVKEMKEAKEKMEVEANKMKRVLKKMESAKTASKDEREKKPLTQLSRWWTLLWKQQKRDRDVEQTGGQAVE